jgi:hypothetical protein
MDYKHLILFVFSFCIFFHWASGRDPHENSAQKRKLKILVYSPSISWSHAQFLGKIADTLAGAGHEVVSLLFFSNRK